MQGRILLASLALALVPLLAGCGGEPPKDTGEFTFFDMHEALVQPGKVFHAEYSVSAEGGQRPSYTAWYWAERGVSRADYFSDPGVHRSTEVITPERETSVDFPDNYVSDHPIPASPEAPRVPIAAGPLRAYFPAPANTSPINGVVASESNQGATKEDGRSVLHLRATLEALKDGHERPAGTRYQFDVYFDAATHLPVRSEMRVSYPGQTQDSGPLIVTFTTTEFIDAASLAPDFFDPDVLLAEAVTLDEAIDIAANADFAIFWLGRSLAADWVAPRGARHSSAELTQVNAPGTAQRNEPGSASLWYSMPPDFEGPMLMAAQSSAASSQLQPRDVEAMRAAGNVFPLDGLDGYVYAQYSPRGSCSGAAAQSDPGCRIVPDAVYGAVVTIDGTTIHILATRISSVGGTAANDNPFSRRDVMERLAPELRPIGE